MTQTLPKLEVTAVTEPFWKGLEKGELLFQRCESCGANQLPPRRECTNCLDANLAWAKASGKGKLITWVDYHRAYDPSFKDQIPYNVAIVELEEGPRLVTNIVTDDPENLQIDQPLAFRPANRFGQTITSFHPI